MKHFLLHAAHIILHVSWTLATACFGGDFWGAGWTGLRVCVGDPIHAVRGDSDCGPCNRVVSDLRAYTRGTKWKVGFSEFTNGVPNDIAIVRAAQDQPTPYVEVVVDGSVTRIVSGYRGDLEQEVLRLYPLPLARVTKPPVTSSRTSVARSAGPTWTWPGDLKSHLWMEHGYAMSWLDTLSTAELVALHDNAHNARAITATPTIRSFRTVAPTYYSAPSHYQSSGVHAFGVPLFGTYRSGSTCPGGICP